MTLPTSTLYLSLRCHTRKCKVLLETHGPKVNRESTQKRLSVSGEETIGTWAMLREWGAHYHRVVSLALYCFKICSSVAAKNFYLPAPQSIRYDALLLGRRQEGIFLPVSIRNPADNGWESKEHSRCPMETTYIISGYNRLRGDTLHNR